MGSGAGDCCSSGSCSPSIDGERPHRPSCAHRRSASVQMRGTCLMPNASCRLSEFIHAFCGRAATHPAGRAENESSESLNKKAPLGGDTKAGPLTRESGVGRVRQYSKRYTGCA